MNKNQPAPSSPGLKLGDIYHTLFRHKWKILAVWSIGVLAAALIWVFWPVPYQSSARLLVRYVLDNRSISPIGADSNIKTPDQRGDSIMNSEVEILTSYDLALEVADAVGPGRILAKAGGGTNRYEAAALIRNDLVVDAPRSSTVIHLVFQHPDPQVVQPVLNHLIDTYLKKHAQIHQMAGTLDDYLTQQTDQLRTQLLDTERQLRQAKSNINVLSIADAKKSYSDQLTSIRNQLFSAQADLAERRAALTELTNMLSTFVQTNIPAQPAVQPVTPAPILSQYKDVCSLLDSLKKQQQQLLTQYTTNNYQVQAKQAQIDANQQTKEELEKEYPDLVGTAVSSSTPSVQPAVTRKDLLNQIAKVRETQSRIAVLNQQLEEVHKQITAVNGAEGTITDLERKRDLLEQNYTHFSTSLNNARFDETLGAGRNSNINVIQSPSPPAKDTGKLYKALAMLLAGALAAGIALAFVVELYLDRSFKRPIEVESKLAAPLFLSVPRAKLNGKHQLANGAHARRLLTEGKAETKNDAREDSPKQGSSEIAPWNQNHRLRSYFETLRDRLIMYFEVRNLTHKPKLVAVTSCAEGSGVSTIASGLASCLSETGDGNVLLVDMNDVEGGAAAYFHKGKLECGLDDALETEKRDSAMVQDNLYVVSETNNNGKLPQILHKRFSSLMPKLKASDYDYIIFDMPPVSQISPTTRLARFMDMMFMVVEAEKTDRDVVQRATDLLRESQGTVGVVLNKQRSYVPKALQQEL